MRTRAGIVLIENNKVALIERHRAGLDYFVFPGGGVDEGETPEQGAVREAMEELGVKVAIKQKVAVIHFDQSTQVYFLVEQVGGEFGSGSGEEDTDADPDSPEEGIYIPIWMPIDELSWREKIYPESVVKLVLDSKVNGWLDTPVVIDEKSRS
ncbi:MAG TPA: NUDIX domain-containing protein [Anaerolineales bacterium]